MTLSEFKAWFEGFTDGMEGAPTEAQFAKIKEKVSEIDQVAITERVYVDRYVHPYRHWWNTYWATNMPDTDPWIARLSGNGDEVARANGGVAHFASEIAMREFGRMEAISTP